MVRTRTLTIERNEKKMDVLLGHCPEVTPLQNKLIDQFESVAARQPSSLWERWAKLDVEQLNKFRVRAYVLHQLVQLDKYGTDVLSFTVADAGSNIFAMENIARAYRSVNDLLQSHKKDTAIIDEWLAELYLTVEPLAFELWRFRKRGTANDLVGLMLMRDQTAKGKDKPLIRPELKEAAPLASLLDAKGLDQQLDARCKLEKDLNDTLQLGNVEIVEFFVTTEPALVEQFVKEGK
jgi:hypothetical protein